MKYMKNLNLIYRKISFYAGRSQCFLLLWIQSLLTSLVILDGKLKFVDRLRIS